MYTENHVDISYSNQDTNQNSDWWHSTVLRTSVYDGQTFPGLSHDMQLMDDLLGVTVRCVSANMANSAIHPLVVDK